MIGPPLWPLSRWLALSRNTLFTGVSWSCCYLLVLVSGQSFSLLQPCSRFLVQPQFCSWRFKLVHALPRFCCRREWRSPLTVILFLRGALFSCFCLVRLACTRFYTMAQERGGGRSREGACDVMEGEGMRYELLSCTSSLSGCWMNRYLGKFGEVNW